MKIFLLFFFLLLGHSASEGGLDLGSTDDFEVVKNILEIMKEMMKTGNETVGIPKMDPYLQYSMTDHEIK